MYARLLAFVCLLSAGAFAASAERALEGHRQIAVYLPHQTIASEIVIDAMRRETGALMHASGYNLRWLERPREVTVAFLVVLSVEGSCEADASPAIASSIKTLASTSIENGRILPFIQVNCAALQQFLYPVLSARCSQRFLFGRALGRLLAHELYHVVSQTTDHSSRGVARAAVSASDLISEQFTFGEDAMQRLRPPRVSSQFKSREQPTSSALELRLQRYR